MDNQGTVLSLKGRYFNGKMQLKSDKIKSQENNTYYINMISWWREKNGDVIQKWEIIDLNGKILQVAFEGRYIKKK